MLRTLFRRDPASLNRPGGLRGWSWRYDQFNYDALGNRRGANYVQTKGWTQYTRKDNGLNQYSGSSPSFFTQYDEDVSGWGTPGQANGVLMEDGNIVAGYNALNQPMLINTQAMGSNWLFLGYDPLGRCVKRWMAPLPSDGTLIPPPESNPATYFYYEGWNLIQEGTSFANPMKNYIHGARVDEIVKQIRPTDWWERYFHYDARGHCTLQTDSAGNIVEQYEYDAFGQPYFYDAWGNNVGYSAWGNRFLFTGREYLSDLKLYDYRNRLYQPELGRFVQPDPKEFSAGDYNLYRYCHNDPVNKSDPTGMDWGVNPEMPKDYQRRTLEQVARARALDKAVDDKFRKMESNHNTKTTITSADTRDNKKAETFADGTRGNSTEARGRDAIIYFDPDNWQSANGYRDPVIGLVHELPHAERINEGTYDDNRFSGGLSQEREAIRFENIIRRLIDGSHRNEDYLHKNTPSDPTITYPYK